MKKVNLRIIYNGIWEINTFCFEKNIGPFFKRIFKKYIDIDNDNIKLFFGKTTNNIRFIILDNKYRLLSLNSKVPNKILLIAININTLLIQEKQYKCCEDLILLHDYIYKQEDFINFRLDKEKQLEEITITKGVIEKVIKPSMVKKVVSNNLIQEKQRNIVKKNKDKDKNVKSSRLQSQEQIREKFIVKKKSKELFKNLKVFRKINGNIKIIKRKKEKLSEAIVEKKDVMILKESQINQTPSDLTVKNKEIELDKNKIKKKEKKNVPSKIHVIVSLKKTSSTVLTLFDKPSNDNANKTIVKKDKNKLDTDINKKEIHNIKTNNDITEQIVISNNESNSSSKEKKDNLTRRDSSFAIEKKQTENSNKSIKSSQMTETEKNKKKETNSKSTEKPSSSVSNTPKQETSKKEEMGKAQTIYSDEGNSKSSNNSKKDLDKTQNMSVKEKRVDTTIIHDKSATNHDREEKIDNKSKEENKEKIKEETQNKKQEENKEESQTISYTVVSPANEILYHKEITSINPISVEDLLLQSGLNINNSNGFIESINGISNQGMAGWVFEVNNAPIMVSASDYIINPSDQITWKYVDFSKIVEKEDSCVEEEVPQKTLKRTTKK